MHAVKHEDTSALIILIERWEPRLLNFIFRYVQNESVARDLVQETFVRIYQARNRYDEDRTFSTWMFMIATNLCRNHQRWVRRHSEVPMDDYLEPVEDQSPADHARLMDSRGKVARAIAALPHPLRTAVLLYYFENLSYQEISAITGCSVRGVESRLYRARKVLESSLLRVNRIHSNHSSLHKSERLPV